MWWPWKSDGTGEPTAAKLQEEPKAIGALADQVAREGEAQETLASKMEIEEVVAQGLLDKTQSLEAVVAKQQELEDRLKEWQAQLEKKEKDLQRREMELVAGQSGLAKGLADLSAAKADFEKRKTEAVHADGGIQVVAPDGSTSNFVEHKGTVLSDNDAVVAIPTSGLNESMVVEAVETMAGVAANFLHCFGGNCPPTKVASKEEGHAPHHGGSHMSFFD